MDNRRTAFLCMQNSLFEGSDQIVSESAHALFLSINYSLTRKTGSRFKGVPLR